MGQPKKRTTPRRTGMRRSHQVLKLARRVNATSPVKAATSSRELRRLSRSPDLQASGLKKLRSKS